MNKSKWNTQKIYSNSSFFLKGVTSLTLYNSGESKVYFRERTLEKGDYYLLEGDGTASDIDLEISFENGRGEAILDYRALQKCRTE